MPIRYRRNGPIDVAVRRASFVFLLLCSGPAAVYCFNYAFNLQRAADGSVSAAWTMFGGFMWGADSLDIVLAVWLVGRHGVWKSWSGWIRAVIYLLAFNAGRVLYEITAERVYQYDTTYFARPAVDLLTVLMLVWLLLPAFAILNGRLAATDGKVKQKTSYTFAALIGWTALAALILGCIRLLTLENFSPVEWRTWMTPAEVTTEYLTEYLPALAIRAVAVTALLLSWSGRWWMPVLGFFAVVTLDATGHQWLYAALEHFTAESFDSHVLARPGLRRWSYAAGRNALVLLAFGGAAVTGIRFRRQLHTTGTEHDFASAARVEQAHGP